MERANRTANIEIIKDYLINGTGFGYEIPERLIIIPLESIVEPIFYLMNIETVNYLVYVLQDRFIKGYKGVVGVQDWLIVESNKEDIEQMLTNQLSIYETLAKAHNKNRLMKLGGKVYPMEQVGSLEQELNKLPRLGYKLDLGYQNAEEILRKLK